MVAFAALVAANSFGFIPKVAAEAAADTSRWMLVTAISALGVKTSLKAMTEVGGGHIGIVVIETLVLLGAAVALVTWGGVVQ